MATSFIASIQGAVFLGPSPYLSFGDSPFAATQFEYFYLENFEDGALSEPGAMTNGGWIVFGPDSFADSVDDDDGIINGTATSAHSLLSAGGQSNLTVTFDPAPLDGFLPTHAGIVFTDVGMVLSGPVGISDVTFEAFDADGNSLGSITATNLGNGSASGESPGAMAEDRFFGVIHSGGISKISLTAHNSVDWEVDHLQYGYLPPQLRLQFIAPNAVLLAWPTNTAGFVLQENTNVTTTNWIANTNAPSIVVGEFQVTISPLSANKFFRLASP